MGPNLRFWFWDECYPQNHYDSLAGTPAPLPSIRTSC